MNFHKIDEILWYHFAISLTRRNHDIMEDFHSTTWKSRSLRVAHQKFCNFHLTLKDKLLFHSLNMRNHIIPLIYIQFNKYFVYTLQNSRWNSLLESENWKLELFKLFLIFTQTIQYTKSASSWFLTQCFDSRLEFSYQNSNSKFKKLLKSYSLFRSFLQLEKLQTR